MIIRYLVPGPMDSREVRRREQLLTGWAPVEVEASVLSLTPGPRSVESSYEEHLTVPALVKALVDAEQEGVDAIIVGCAGDPGVEALREIATKTLVIGPGSTAAHTAALLGDSFGIVTPPGISVVRRQMTVLGLRDRLAGIAEVDIPVVELGADTGKTIAVIAGAARSLIDLGADTVVLGCMSMAFLDADIWLSEQLGVPVVNPAKVAIGVAATMVHAGLMPSKLAYPVPPKLAAGRHLAELLSCQ